MLGFIQNLILTLNTMNNEVMDLAIASCSLQVTSWMCVDVKKNLKTHYNSRGESQTDP